MCLMTDIFFSHDQNSDSAMAEIQIQPHVWQKYIFIRANFIKKRINWIFDKHSHYFKCLSNS